MMAQVLHHLDWLLLWGLIATCVMAAAQEGTQHFGLSRISFPFLLGAFFTGNRRHAEAIGFVIYLLGGFVFATGYGCLFESLHRANGWIGALAGLAQGLVMLLIVLPALPSFHPRMASPHDGPEAARRIEPPGFLALHYGARAPLIHLLGQVLFGLILGLTYPL
jgi:hypothetical protein